MNEYRLKECISLKIANRTGRTQDLWPRSLFYLYPYRSEHARGVIFDRRQSQNRATVRTFPV